MKPRLTPPHPTPLPAAGRADGTWQAQGGGPEVKRRAGLTPTYFPGSVPAGRNASGGGVWVAAGLADAALLGSVLTAGLDFTQILMINNMYQQKPKMPIIPGG
eukprot:COSAG04_NODE_12556_length_647_cov_0.697080_1_plen_102_part_10